MSFLTDVVIMELVLDRQPPPCCCLIIRLQNTGLGQRLGKACHLVDLANSDARLKKIMYPKLGLNLATVESRPNSL